MNARWIGALLWAATCVLAPIASAVESDPLPVPKGTSREHAVTAYNDGVKLMRRHVKRLKRLRKSVLALMAHLLSSALLLVFFPLVVVMYCAWFVRPAEWRRLVAPVVAMISDRA